MDLSRLTERLLDLPNQGILFYDEGRLVRKSYPEVFADVETVSSRLKSWGVEPEMRVGLLAENCYEWILHDLALLRLGCTSVCFPPEEFASASFESLAEKYALHLFLISDKERKRRKETARGVALLNAENEDEVSTRQYDGRQGERNQDIFSLDPDVMTLAFSSGTSGKLKCLLISKRGAEAWLDAFGQNYKFEPSDGMLVVLPLSNYQQRLMVYTAICYGFDMHLTDPFGLFRALKEMRPTILIGPPAFYETLENRFRALPPSKRALLSSVGWLINNVTFGGARRKLLRKWFDPFYSAFGGNISLMLTGMAPSRQSTLDLFAFLGLPLYQVYGLTETGLVAWNLPGANRPGSVGKPVFENAVTIADDGEIIVHYENPLSLGYLHCDKEEERQTYLGGNRIATGDLGKFDKDRYLYIIGRKKQTIITQGGYKIQPEVLERAIEQCPEVARAVVFGGGELPNLVGLVSLRSNDGSEVERRVQGVVDKLNREVPSPSQIARLVFTTSQFTTENGFLTRNLKVDRRAVFDAFRESLMALK